MGESLYGERRVGWRWWSGRVEEKRLGEHGTWKSRGNVKKNEMGRSVYGGHPTTFILTLTLVDISHTHTQKHSSSERATSKCRQSWILFWGGCTLVLEQEFDKHRQFCVCLFMAPHVWSPRHDSGRVSRWKSARTVCARHHLTLGSGDSRAPLGCHLMRDRCWDRLMRSDQTRLLKHVDEETEVKRNDET